MAPVAAVPRRDAPARPQKPFPSQSESKGRLEPHSSDSRRYLGAPWAQSDSSRPPTAPQGPKCKKRPQQPGVGVGFSLLTQRRAEYLFLTIRRRLHRADGRSVRQAYCPNAPAPTPLASRHGAALNGYCGGVVPGRHKTSVRVVHVSCNAHSVTLVTPPA